ncbi:MAG: hypothetical protein ACXWUB_01995 [Burkholderiales bacterium]
MQKPVVCRRPYAVGFLAAAPVLLFFGVVTWGVFLAYEALTGGNAPPDIAVRADRIVAQEQGYLVEISATNRGDRTAAAVQVQAELKNGAETVESSEVQFQYLPARSERKGGVYFTHDPRRLKLVIRARGYAYLGFSRCRGGTRRRRLNRTLRQTHSVVVHPNGRSCRRKKNQRPDGFCHERPPDHERAVSAYHDAMQPDRE